MTEKADLRDGKLVVAETQAHYMVTPACHVRKLVTGADDAKLLSKVKTEDQLKALGAEQLADSLLLGETAYEVTPGYIAEVPLTAGKPADKKTHPESDMLAAFLLDKL